MMIRIGRPLRPPLALIVFSERISPLRSLTPSPAPTPVTDRTAPNLIGSAAVAWAHAAVSYPTTLAAVPIASAAPSNLLVMVSFLPSMHLLLLVVCFHPLAPIGRNLA